MKSIYRYLIVLCALLTVVFWTMPYFDYMWFSNEQLHLLDKNGLGAKIPGNDFTYWGTLFIWLLLSAGLFLYNKRARSAFVGFYIISTLSGLFYGVQVLTPYEATISALINLADGTILTMAYLTSVGTMFEKTPNKHSAGLS